MSSIDIPAGLWPLLTLLAGAGGAWVGVKLTVAQLQVKMDQVQQDVKEHGEIIARHNDDLLVHDMEIESALGQLDLPRARRQRLRGA